MALRTGSPIHRIIAMALFEGGLGSVMAAQAKRTLRLHQQIFFIRTVSIVTTRAALGLQCFVGDFLLIVLLLVTLVANLVTLRF